MTNTLKQIKSLGLVAIAAIFLFSATLISCGDKKENADNTEENTEMKMDSAATEHPNDTENHDEHPSDSAAHEEHPAGGEEHPAN